MSLPEDDAKLFNLLVEWLYSRHYDLSLPTGDRYIDCARFMEPTQLYVLANKYAVTKLKNHVAETLFHNMKLRGSAGPDIDTVAYAYRNLPRTSGFRTLLADFHACNIKHEWYEQAATKRFLQKNPKFAFEVLMSFGEMPGVYRDKE